MGTSSCRNRAWEWRVAEKQLCRDERRCVMIASCLEYRRWVEQRWYERTVGVIYQMYDVDEFIEKEASMQDRYDKGSASYTLRNEAANIVKSTIRSERKNSSHSSLAFYIPDPILSEHLNKKVNNHPSLSIPFRFYFQNHLQTSSPIYHLTSSYLPSPFHPLRKRHPSHISYSQ